MKWVIYMVLNQNTNPSFQRVRELIRGNYVTRDDLYATAEALSDVELAEICLRLAGELSGHVEHLQQLLMAGDQKPVEPEPQDEISRRLQGIIIELLDERHGQRAVLGEAKAAEQRLKEEYDAAIEAVSNPKVEDVLRQQREEVAFTEIVLNKVQERIINDKLGG